MKQRDILVRGVNCLLFAFPLAAIGVRHGASTIFALFALVGILLWWDGWKLLPCRERRFIYSLCVFLGIVLISALRSDDISRGLRKFERYLRILFFVPGLLFLVRIRIQNAGRTFLAGSLLAAVAGFGYAASEAIIPFELFNVPLEMSESLERGELSPQLREEFRRNGYPLSNIVDISSSVGKWSLRDENQRWVEITKKETGLIVKGPKRVRAVGPYDSIMLGSLSMHLAAIIVAWLFTSAKQWWEKFIGSFCMACAVYCSLLTGTRGAWLLIPLLFITAVIIWVKRLRPKQLVVSIIALVGLGIVGQFLLPKSVTSRMGALPLAIINPGQALSSSERAGLWRISLSIWADSPILGSGLGDFRKDLIRKIENKQSGIIGIYDHAHSIYFEALAQTGLVGTIALVSVLLVLPFRNYILTWKGTEDTDLQFIALAGMLTVVSFSVFGLTEAWFSRMPFVTSYVVSNMVFMAESVNAASKASVVKNCGGSREATDPEKTI
ncbi:MAG: O-antigen ligase family protein [Planctomycetota bacterium]|nr:O-antigen ligase family protein [Planctomycetota bacterium]